MMVVKLEDVMLLSSHLKQHCKKESHTSFKYKTYLQHKKRQKTALELLVESLAVGCGHRTGRWQTQAARLTVVVTYMSGLASLTLLTVSFAPIQFRIPKSNLERHHNLGKQPGT